MAFQFGFTGEDDDDADPQPQANAHNAGNTGDLKPVQDHTLRDMLDALPERVSYSTVRIESPTGRVVHLPRRELFDVRAQLLGEGGAENEDVVDQIDKSDIRSGVYEGGFKTWECSQDLASLLLDRGPRKDIDELIRCDQIIELGAGTALPTLILFQHALTNAIPMKFILSDYNDSVLRLVTLPNLLLTWAATTQMPEAPSLDLASSGDLEITEIVLSRFAADLQSNNINLVFLSGPWSSRLADMVSPSGQDSGTLILAAETIYSPSSTAAFTNLLVTILKRVKMSKAMIGAKRIYFGVGGSVDGLKEACREMGAVAYEIENHGVPHMDSGVGRALIEVQMF